MVFFSSLLSVVAIAVAGVSAFPAGAFTQSSNRTDLVARTVEQPGEGTFDGFFLQLFTAGSFDVIFTNIAGGQFEVQWD